MGISPISGLLAGGLEEERMRCGHCKAENPEGATLCSACSAALNPCPSCGFANPAGFRFCGACGTALAPNARTPARRDYTPRHLAAEVLASRAALEGERKQVTVLFADVKGSQALAASVDAEQWHAILDRFFAILTAGVHRFEGTVNQYTGDGIMALFGAPIAHEDHAQRACLAALSVREELARYSAELQQSHGLLFSVRMGLNSGEVVVGKIGDDLRMDYTAQGETVGLAARMEQLAEPGRIYVTEQTAALADGFVALKDRGRFSVKGARRALRVYELLGEGAMHTRLDLSRQRGFAPFVGRSDLVAELEAALSAAASGKGHAIEIAGEAGIGKSRLCWEFAERCRDRGVSVLEVRPRPGHARRPFDPILDLLRAALDIPRDGPPDAVREHLAAKLEPLGKPVMGSLPVLIGLLGVADPLRPAPRMDPEARRRHIERALGAILARRSAEQPMVVIFEDVHAFDAASIAVLDHLVRQLPRMHVLLLVNRRTDGLESRVTGSREVRLEPLGADATHALARALLGEHASVAELVQEVAAASGGNPFFVEEIVHSLVASHALKGSDGDYRATAPIGRPSLPATVQALLAARIDSLAESEKALLQAAAVIGREFDVGLLQKLLGSTKTNLARPLKRLSAAGFLEPVPANGTTAYAFRQTLMQEVAYRSQLTPQRQRLHARLAEVMATGETALVDARAARIAEHWEAAGQMAEAVEWHARAARWLGPNDPAEAYRRWKRVGELVGEKPESAEEHLLAWRARAQQVNLGWRLGVTEKEIAADFAAAEALAQSRPTPEALAATYGAYGLARGMAGHIREANDALMRATGLLDDGASAGLRVALHLALAHTQAAIGELPEALATTERALGWTEDDATLGRDRAGMSPRPLLLGLRASVLAQMGRFAEARTGLEQALQLARELDEIEVQVFIFAWRVALAVFTGEDPGVLDSARQGLEAAEQTGSTFSRVTALAAAGQAHALRGEWSETVAASAEALDLARARRAGLTLEAQLLSVLAEADLGLDDYRRAESTAKEAVAVARHRGARVDECAALLAYARVRLAGKKPRHRRGAPKLLDAASRIVADTGARVFEPFILAARAAVAMDAGDEEAAARDRQAAERLFRSMGARARARKMAGKAS
jgi:class 3 adenylate cyclase/tetratricopeptide (TPR) repeat protein